MWQVMDAKFFVETIGNANEEVIRSYVQNRLKVMNTEMKHDSKGSSKLGRLRTSSL